MYRGTCASPLVRSTLVFRLVEFPPSVFTSRVVVTTSSRTEFPTVRLLSSGRARAGRRRRGGETSQQRQGARRAEEMGR
ncbi:hypothetical protein Taro_045851 [Colocasia esculenta]|uniref:Uncharacterized protein n=1 Tax=Colocasia esculenta TaxID=4460 RepID=A0A843WSA9_COLES|nr:hypothetical protein [Colocasia esculenta]